MAAMEPYLAINMTGQKWLRKLAQLIHMKINKKKPQLLFVHLSSNFGSVWLLGFPTGCDQDQNYTNWSVRQRRRRIFILLDMACLVYSLPSVFYLLYMLDLDKIEVILLVDRKNITQICSWITCSDNFSLCIAGNAVSCSNAHQITFAEPGYAHPTAA